MSFSIVSCWSVGLTDVSKLSCPVPALIPAAGQVWADSGFLMWGVLTLYFSFWKKVLKAAGICSQSQWFGRVTHANTTQTPGWSLTPPASSWSAAFLQRKTTKCASNPNLFCCRFFGGVWCMFRCLFLCSSDVLRQAWTKLLLFFAPPLLQRLYAGIFRSLGGSGNVAGIFIYDSGLKRCKENTQTHTF